MKKFTSALIVGFALLSATVSFAVQTSFTGSFSGFYAPINWTTTVSGSSSYIIAPSVITAGAPDNLTILGSLGTGTVPNPPTYIDYSVVVPGSGLQSVSFSYTFYSSVGIPADLLRNGVSVASLTGANQQFTLNGVYTSGDILGFRVTSANVNQFPFLQIAPIPEPSTLALLSLGGMVAFAKFRRKR